MTTTTMAIPADRDRVIDLTRAVSLTMVAIGHWLVTDVHTGADGNLAVTDVLAELPGLSGLTWLFQVMPLFFFAGGAVGFASWQRHRAEAGTWAQWMGQRLLRLWWPTVPVLAFWVVATQVAARVFGVSDGVLAATRGIALVIWFLAIYVLVVALTAPLDRAAARLGPWLPVILAAAAGTVDAVGFATDYVSSTTPSWVWVNYVLVWSTIYVLGRWWGPIDDHRARLGLVAAGTAVGVLVALVTVGPYPVSMVGVAGQTRSNSLPPTLALLVLGVAQVGGLWWLRPRLAAWLRSPSRYGPVALVGARAMTLYLWHLLAVAVLTVGLVLPGWWPTTDTGSAAWWLARLGWVLAATTITTPVVLLLSRLERPPGGLRARASTVPVVAATASACVGWAALAIAGFHTPGLPAELPWYALGGTTLTALLLIRPARRPPGQTS